MDDNKKRMINVFQALGTESRLKIIEFLSERNYTTKELADLLERKPSTISKHLRILKDLGFVWFKTHKGNSIYYLKRVDILELIDKAKEILSRK
ncbi:winged helix-turn-helix transcriptional regulator [candidate division WOR-3 bacterium]|nr:winged helix-turn-helix transcriptional regulator [candidate division WOR-3 bacterium]